MPFSCYLPALPCRYISSPSPNGSPAMDCNVMQIKLIVSGEWISIYYRISCIWHTSDGNDGYLRLAEPCHLCSGCNRHTLRQTISGSTSHNTAPRLCPYIHHSKWSCNSYNWKETNVFRNYANETLNVAVFWNNERRRIPETLDVPLTIECNQRLALFQLLPTSSACVRIIHTVSGGRTATAGSILIMLLCGCTGRTIAHLIACQLVLLLLHRDSRLNFDVIWIRHAWLAKDFFADVGHLKYINSRTIKFDEIKRRTKHSLYCQTGTADRIGCMWSTSDGMYCPWWTQPHLPHTVCMRYILCRTISDSHWCSSMYCLWRKIRQRPTICGTYDIESIVYESTFRPRVTPRPNIFSDILCSIFSLCLQKKRKTKPNCNEWKSQRLYNRFKGLYVKDRARNVSKVSVRMQGTTEQCLNCVREHHWSRPDIQYLIIWSTDRISPAMLAQWVIVHADTIFQKFTLCGVFAFVSILIKNKIFLSRNDQNFGESSYVIPLCRRERCMWKSIFD